MKRHVCVGCFLFLTAWLTPAPVAYAAGSPPAHEAAIFRDLLGRNDDVIAEVLTRLSAAESAYPNSRELGALLMIFSCGYASTGSSYHRDPRLVPAMERFAEKLCERQHPSGLFDAGNLESPPDTAFILETLCKAQSAMEAGAHAATAGLRALLKDLILAAAEGVRTGGVHTPNHRWGVCAALAQVNRLYPDASYVERIDTWLAEGIDQDADGQYSERSPAYSGKVVNPALLTLAVLLDRPRLLEPVRKNLEMMLYYAEPDGELESVASRRQDQRAGVRSHLWDYYVPYRYLAIRDQNGVFAAAARWIERDFSANLLASPTDPNWPLSYFLEFPELRQELPPATALPAHFAKVFSGSGIARIRRDNMTATVFGGSDWHTGFGPASGLSTNPTFFKLRKGDAVLESVRMTPSFFGTGFFYSEGLQAEGACYRLSQTLRVPYHLPLPPAHRRPDGDYALSADGRFFSKLDFDRRPKQYRTLRSEIVITENADGFVLDFSVEGHPGVPVTIELSFGGDGVLHGVTPLDAAPTSAVPEGTGVRWLGPQRRPTSPHSEQSRRFALTEDRGRFTAGSDTIEFGPGHYVQAPSRMEGEAYTWVDGSLRAEGQRVYLTGVTPFHTTLSFK